MGHESGERGEDDRPARGWMFWRADFWTRPALLALVGVASLASVPFLVFDGYRDMRNQGLLDDGRWCATASAPCFETIAVELDGPRHGRRAMGSEWTATDADHYDDFHVVEGYDEAIAAADRPVTVYSVEGDVIAVLVDSEVVEVWGLGTRGAMRATMVALAAVGFAIGSLGWARAKAAAQGGWWSVGARYPLEGSPWATVFLLPAAVALLAMIVGISAWQVWVAAWVVATVGILAARRPWLRGPRLGPEGAV